MKKAFKNGFSLIEVMFVIIIIAVAMLALMGTLTRLPILDESNNEEIIAIQACQTKMEELQQIADASFSTLFSRFNGSVVDDPLGLESPGENFEVPGLNPWATDTDGLCGEINFPETNDVLDETVGDADWGIDGIDMDGDGLADNTAVTTYKIIPVRVTVRFRSIAGHDTERTLVSTYYGTN